MTDDDLHRQVEKLAQRFEAEGFIVTRQLEIDAKGAATYWGVSPKTLRNWRTEGCGPSSSRTVRRVAFYRIADLVRWRRAAAGRSVLAEGGAARTKSARGGTSP